MGDQRNRSKKFMGDRGKVQPSSGAGITSRNPIGFGSRRRQIFLARRTENYVLAKQWRWDHVPQPDWVGSAG